LIKASEGEHGKQAKPRPARFEMNTVNTIHISAGPDEVYQAASDLLNWPKMLPHYRWVRRLGAEGERGIFEMAARRSWVPVRWVSAAMLDPRARRIYFHHIAGLTRGMRVVWEIEPHDGGTSVAIRHDLTALEVPIVRSRPGKLITGRVFVEHIADRTLHFMKRWIEAGCGARS